MDGTVPNDRWLGIRPFASPEVDALDRASLGRLASDEDLRVLLKCLLEVSEEVEMFLKDVIGIEV